MRIATLLGMQQLTMYGLVECLQESSVFKTLGRAGLSHKRARRMHPLPLCQACECELHKGAGREGAGLLTPLFAASPTLTHLYPSKSVWKLENTPSPSYNIITYADRCFFAVGSWLSHSFSSVALRHFNSSLSPRLQIRVLEISAPAPTGSFLQQVPAVPVTSKMGICSAFCCQQDWFGICFSAISVPGVGFLGRFCWVLFCFVVVGVSFSSPLPRPPCSSLDD